MLEVCVFVRASTSFKMSLEKLVPHQLYDINGDAYTIHIKPQEVYRYDIDHAFAFRKLKALKASGQKPDGQWASVMVESRDESLSVWQPGGRAASGTVSRPISAACNLGPKVGANWSKETVNVFLSICKLHREDLRVRYVSKEVWISVSESMSAMGLSYSPAQLAEKMRNLKAAFHKAKSGARKIFVNYSDMEFIYDSPIPDNPESVCDEMVSPGGYTTYVNGKQLPLCLLYSF